MLILSSTFHTIALTRTPLLHRCRFNGEYVVLHQPNLSFMDSILHIFSTLRMQLNNTYVCSANRKRRKRSISSHATGVSPSPCSSHHQFCGMECHCHQVNEALTDWTVTEVNIVEDVFVDAQDIHECNDDRVCHTSYTPNDIVLYAYAYNTFRLVGIFMDKALQHCANPSHSNNRNDSVESIDSERDVE
jgi:hypothetical protein